MKNIQHVSIIGSGSFGMAMASLISQKVEKVSLIDPLQSNKDSVQVKKIKLTGAIDIDVTLDDVRNNYDQISKSDIILLTLTGDLLENIFIQLLEKIKKGQHIILFPGAFSAIALRNLIGEQGQLKDITISEAVSLPFVCDMVDANTIQIHKFKNKLKLSTFPHSLNSRVLDILNTFIDIFIPARNLLETSMENINSVIHPLPILLNIVEIENKGSEFKHYIDGVNPTISRLIEQMDRERLEVGKAFSLNLIPVLDQLKMYYGQNKSKTVYEYINSSLSPYKEIKGFGINSRYLTHDIPNLVVPLSFLAEIVNVKTPLIDLTIKLASIILEKDFRETGNNLNKLQMEGETVPQILNKMDDL